MNSPAADTTSDGALASLRRDPSGAALGLRRPLPAGQVVDGEGGRALMWLSEAAPTAADVAWARAAHGITGLWPVLLGGDPGAPTAALARPGLGGRAE